MIPAILDINTCNMSKEVKVLVVMFYSLQPMDYHPPGSSLHGILQANGVGSHSLLQGIFPSQEPGSPALQADCLPSEPSGKPIKHTIKKWDDFRERPAWWRRPLKSQWKTSEYVERSVLYLEKTCCDLVQLIWEDLAIGKSREEHCEHN